MLDYLTNTYEVTADTRQQQLFDRVQNINDADRQPGRPINKRLTYLSQHPMHNKTYRVVRTEGHNTLPNFIGKWFPQRNDTNLTSFYSASMLLLLKPWRDIHTDLKSTNDSWFDSLQNFRDECRQKGNRMEKILSGIQYYHDCELAANEEYCGWLPPC